MKTSRTVLALGSALLLGTLTMGSVASAQTPAPPAPQNRQAWQDKMLGRLQQKLGLTDDQVTQIRQVQDRHRDARRQVYTSLRQANAQLRQLALTGTDDAAFQQKTSEVQALVGQSIALRAQTLREIAPILTPEQRQAWAQMKHGRGRGPQA
jgi:Spy/CpxP family protein refolding chaperone